MINIICTIVCLVCCAIVVFIIKRFKDILKQLDEEQLRKIWEVDLYEKDNKN